MLNDLQWVFTRNVAKLIEYIFSQGYACSLGEAYRPDWVAQKYAKEGKGIRDSLHTIRLAVDLNLFLDRKYLVGNECHKPFGDYWETLHPNNRWGGRYGDGNHYEMLLKAKDLYFSDEEKRKNG